MTLGINKITQPATNNMLDTIPVHEWKVSDAKKWANNIEGLSQNIITCLENEEMDGQILLALEEEDIRFLRYRLSYKLTLSDIKRFWINVRKLQMQYVSKSSSPTTSSSPKHLQQQQSFQDYEFSENNGIQTQQKQKHQQHQQQHIPDPTSTQCMSVLCSSCHIQLSTNGMVYNNPGLSVANINSSGLGDCQNIQNISPPLSVDGCAKNIPPEIFKTAISLGYSFLVTWITSFVMVIVHERVPDMKRYPPLPDIFLDNVPHIPWAFHMCEITGTLLFVIWACVCFFHKYRMVLLRRFFALAGTVFLLRCVTMLITSLSVPGTHLQCNQNDYAIDDSQLSLMEALESRITRAYIIWSGLGMSIQGVRTCGDYMFSGHTVALTLLNFFITEYTPRNLYFLHTLTWLLNMFGIFFILAAHEHYSIDVFVAFYITSRLFLYYHTLANNQALMSHDSNRTRIWFPMFSYFESSVDGIIPNEYDTFGTLLEYLFQFVINIKDAFMLTTRRYWITQATLQTKNLPFKQATTLGKQRQQQAQQQTQQPQQTTNSKKDNDATIFKLLNQNNITEANLNQQIKSETIQKKLL